MSASPLLAEQNDSSRCESRRFRPRIEESRASRKLVSASFNSSELYNEWKSREKRSKSASIYKN